MTTALDQNRRFLVTSTVWQNCRRGVISIAFAQSPPNKTVDVALLALVRSKGEVRFARSPLLLVGIHTHLADTKAPRRHSPVYAILEREACVDAASQRGGVA